MYSRGLLGPLGLGGARCTAGHGPRAFNLCAGAVAVELRFPLVIIVEYGLISSKSRPQAKELE